MHPMTEAEMRIPARRCPALLAPAFVTLNRNTHFNKNGMDLERC